MTVWESYFVDLYSQTQETNQSSVHLQHDMNKQCKSEKMVDFNLTLFNIHIKCEMTMWTFHKNNPVTMESTSSDELVLIPLQKGGAENFGYILSWDIDKTMGNFTAWFRNCWNS